jgi:hypothetical protein
MQKLLLAALLLVPMPALAHVGHLAEAEGHSHHLAAWALLGVIAGAVWLIWTEPPKAPRARRAKGPEA